MRVAMAYMFPRASLCGTGPQQSSHRGPMLRLGVVGSRRIRVASDGLPSLSIPSSSYESGRSYCAGRPNLASMDLHSGGEPTGASRDIAQCGDDKESNPVQPAATHAHNVHA